MRHCDGVVPAQVVHLARRAPFSLDDDVRIAADEAEAERHAARGACVFHEREHCGVARQVRTRSGDPGRRSARAHPSGPGSPRTRAAASRRRSAPPCGSSAARAEPASAFDHSVQPASATAVIAATIAARTTFFAVTIGASSQRTFAVTLALPLSVNVQVLLLLPPLEQAPVQTASRPFDTLSVMDVPVVNDADARAPHGDVDSGRRRRDALAASAGGGHRQRGRLTASRRRRSDPPSG